MAQKSKLYYATRSVVRAIVKVAILALAYFILHFAASSIWAALFFSAVVTCAYLIHDHRSNLTPVPA